MIMVSYGHRRKSANSKTQVLPAPSASSAGQNTSPGNDSTCPTLRHSRRLHPENDELVMKKEILEASTNGIDNCEQSASSDKKSISNLPSRRSLRSTRHEVPEVNNINDAGSHGDEEAEHEELATEQEERRRSSRQKRFMHSTYNEAAITPLHTVRRVPVKSPSPEQPLAEEGEEDGMDMYTRVKRTRRKIKRDMYGMPLVEEGEKSTEDEETEQDENTGSDEDEEQEEEERDGDGEEDTETGQYNLRRNRMKAKSTAGKYNLRRNKPRTKLYEATIEKKRRDYFKITPPKRYKESNEITFKSPAHRYHRRKKACHRTSSTSSSGSESEDERRFARRKNKSMAKARQRCLPMNLAQGDLTHTLKDRQRLGASLADIDPMSVDRSITFDSVGGLTEHLQALKEMIVFPLLYPEVFERFKIAPPRGVLFHGPPGTGKTLVARALANECSFGEKRVAFFMRKGADCLSKWVGESERQLRLLFDQAYQVRPSIIFFDEIDGLAPVRSSRQDQIHSSIVSTLLALMDGLDSRGEVVVIGATNRIDSIDPALRRPGRFDREFLFNLPPVEARAEILKIHTKEWNPKLLDRFILEVASKCNGYCGADMKALCTEAALHALRRRYPQIYSSKDKLQLDVTSIDISAADFHYAMSKIVPAGQRAVVSPGRPLSAVVKPLLRQQLETLVNILNSAFPYMVHHQSSSSCATSSLLDSIADDSNTNSVTECTKNKRKSKQGNETMPFLDFSVAAYSQPIVSRPRMLLHGNAAQGNSTHLAPAILHCMERMPVHVLDLPTLYANSAKTAEESCAQVFREARRSTPSVIYVPHIDRWWRVLSDTMQATFRMMLSDIDPLMPILLLATADTPVKVLPLEVQELFAGHTDELYEVRQPTEYEIRDFFEDLLLRQTCVPPATRKLAAGNLLEELPKAPVTKSELTEKEEKALWEHEESVLRELRLFLRDMLNKLSRDRKFNIFSKPVDEEEVPDYHEIIQTPMDLSKMMSKIDLHQYQSCTEFLDDIDLICANALEYNPAGSVAGRAIRHRACALKDTAHALIDNELDEEFEKQCAEILESRRNRGQTPTKAAPKYYHTKPLPSASGDPSASNPTGRYSKRLRHEAADNAELLPSSKVLSNKHSGRVSHDITQDDIVSPPRKRRKKSRWALGIPVKGKKHRPKTNVEEECEGRESEGEQENSAATELNGDISEHTDIGQVPVEPSVGDVSQAVVDPNKVLDNCDNSNDTTSTSPLTTSTANEERAADTNALTHTLANGEVREEIGPTDQVSMETDDVQKLESSKSTDQADTHTNATEELNSLKSNTSTKEGGGESNDVPPATPGSNSNSADCGLDVNGSDKPELNGSMSSPPPSPHVDKDSQRERSCNTSPLIKEKVLEMEPQVTRAKRLTRSMTHDQQLNRCREIVEEDIPEFNIDESALPRLLDCAVGVGLRCSVVELEKLYSLLAQKIYHHRSSYDRTLLLQELDEVLVGYASAHS